MLLDYLVLRFFFWTSECFAFFKEIILLKVVSLLSKSVSFFTKSICFNLVAKFPAVHLLNSWVVIYSELSGILF